MRDNNLRIRWVLLVFMLLITLAVILWLRGGPSFFEPLIVWISALFLVVSILTPESYALGRGFNLLIFVASVAWFIYDLFSEKSGVNLEALIAVLFSFAVLVFSIFAPRQLSVTPQLLRAARNSKKRSELIQRVKVIWINGVLANEQEDRPVMPTQLKLVYPESDRLITYTDIDAALREAFGRLLLVGETGSGKTFASLQLTQRLLEEAEKDEDAPVPLIFLLGNWGQRKLPLEEWLLNELESLYKINREVGRAWIIDGKRIVWFLDGLDQVAEDLRRKCVSAINLFCEANPDTSILISSRLGEYETLERRPKLNRVIELVPLTSEQVQSYIQLLELDETAFQSQLESDSQFLELAQNRFMLSLVCDAGLDFTNVGLDASLTQDELRRQVLSSYVELCFQRHGTSVRFPPDYLRKGLSWLGWNMRKDQQSLFRIEKIQPHWLPGFVPNIIYRLLLLLVLATGWVLYGFVAGLVEAVISGSWVVGSSLPWLGGKACMDDNTCFDAVFVYLLVVPIMASILGLMGGASFAIPLALTSRKTIPFEDLAFSRPNALRGLMLGIVVGLLIISLMSSTWYQDGISSLLDSIDRAIGGDYPQDSVRDLILPLLYIIAIYGPVWVLTGSLIAGAIFALTSIFRKLRPNFQELSRWMMVGGIIGMLSGFVGEIREVSGPNLSRGLFVGTILLSMFVSAVVTGFSVELTPDSKVKNRHPNLGIWQSIIRSTVVMAIGLLVVITVLQLVIPWSLLENEKVWKPTIDENYILSVYLLRLIYITFIPPVFGTIYGGLAVIQHLATRVILTLTGYLPVEHSVFLEDACNIGILQRVGGGYQFRHQLFMEHFADSFTKR